MSELKKQARLLRKQIKEAFADVPYPGDENLNDGGRRDDDYDDVVKNLTGKHWRGLIPKRKPPRGRSNPLFKDMIFCSAAARHFFLPAYLITDLMRGTIGTFLFEPERAEHRFRRLNAAQCTAVASFLDYADALLVERPEMQPQHRHYLARQRQELAPILVYWNDRATRETVLESEFA